MSQHIYGDKDLSFDEIERIRKIKALERACDEILNEMFAERDGFRETRIARQYLQTGFMWAKRAIATPDEEKRNIENDDEET